MSFAFQSTLPARGATATRIPVDTHSIISIHAPRTGSDSQSQASYAASQISIHAPRTGSDITAAGASAMGNNFNPRSPHGERPKHMAHRRKSHYFNPRSPHGERPRVHADFRRDVFDFNPRSPHGERPVPWAFSHRLFTYFNPRSPHGERRLQFRRSAARIWISIHAPRTGSDGGVLGACNRPHHFNPRSPHGERPFLQGA